MPRQTATYHLPPSFTIGPAPSGPIGLGTILNNVKEMEALNEGSRNAIPETNVYCHSIRGFTSTRSRMRKGEYGVWAKMVGTEGIGGELSWATSRSDDDEYNFRQLDTVTFTPSAAYLNESMRVPGVANEVEASGYAPVYMVTGLKIAIGPSLNIKARTSFAGRADVGIQQPGGVPIDVGPRFSREGSDGTSETWKDADDFIYGVRVKKLVYKRRWVPRILQSRPRAEGVLEATAYNKGAALVGFDGDSDGYDEGEEISEVDLDEEMDGLVEVNEGEDAIWAVPVAMA